MVVLIKDQVWPDLCSLGTGSFLVAASCPLLQGVRGSTRLSLVFCLLSSSSPEEETK